MQCYLLALTVYKVPNFQEIGRLNYWICKHFYFLRKCRTVGYVHDGLQKHEL